MVDSLCDDIVIANTAPYQDPRDAIRLLNTSKSADAWDQKWVWEERLRQFIGREGATADFSCLPLKDIKIACISLVEPETSINFLAPVSASSTHNPHEAMWNTIVPDVKMYWSSEPGPKEEPQKLVYCARRPGTAFRKVTVIPYSHYYRRYRGDANDAGGLKTFGWDSLSITFYRGGELPVDVHADEAEEALLAQPECEKVYEITTRPSDKRKRKSTSSSSTAASSSSTTTDADADAAAHTNVTNAHTTNRPMSILNLTIAANAAAAAARNAAAAVLRMGAGAEVKEPTGTGSEKPEEEKAEDPYNMYEVDLGEFVCADWMVITLNNRLREEYTNLGWYFCVEKVIVEGSVLFKDYREEKEIAKEKEESRDCNRIQWWATQPDFMRRRTNLPFDRFVYHNWLRLMRSDLLFFPTRR